MSDLDPASQVLFVPDYSQHNPYQRLLAEGLAEQGFRVRYGRPARYLPAPLLRAWLARGRPEAIHIHWTHEYLGVQKGDASGLATASFFAELWLLQAMHVRIVWTIHNLAAHDGEHGLRELAAHRRLADLSDAIICHCSAARDAAVDAFGLDSRTRDKIRVIPHGNYEGEYPDTIDRATARLRLGFQDGAQVFLFIGAVRRYKGIEQLIEAFAKVCAPNARLVIAGRPSDPGIALQLRLASAADPRIALRLEFIPPDELQVYLRACDVVVLPFRDILTSGSAILALSFGRPVIAPSIGCIPETIPRDAGVLYDPADPEGLPRALLEAVSTDWSAIEDSALARARELSWSSIARQTAALYRH
jgi:glycosyltransferase involved in cell wall biosynthesis